MGKNDLAQKTWVFDENNNKAMEQNTENYNSRTFPKLKNALSSARCIAEIHLQDKTGFGSFT